MAPPAARDAREVDGAWTRFQWHSFRSPAPDLAPFVDHYWIVTWDYAGQTPYRQVIVPYPNVHLTFFNGAARVTGVARRHVVKVLDGVGWVFGIAFRPGCFRPFLGRSVATLTDTSAAAGELLGTEPPEREMILAGSERRRVEIAEAYLRDNLPDPDPTAEQAADAVSRIAAQPEITRVGGLADELQTGVRGLQRMFAEYVGVGPKWVIRRYRLHEVTERMAQGDTIDWAGLAADLGYADQAHLVRDFTAVVGESPTRYAERYPR